MTGSAFASTYRRSLEQPDEFWGEAARDIDWIRTWDRVLDASATPAARWFVGGELNTCYNALDRHADGKRADQPALIYDSGVTGTTRFLHYYHELRAEVALFAGVLSHHGVRHGDRVIIYMPMVPQAVIAMLACARLGAVHSVVFGGFAARELAVRIDDCTPRVIVSASCGIEVDRVIEYKPLLDGAIEIAAHKPDHCIVFQREAATAAMQPGPRSRLGGRA